VFDALPLCGPTIMERRWDARERLAKFHDANSTSFTWTNFFVTVVDGIVVSIEAFSVVAILTPLARFSEEAVLAFKCSNNHPHSVSNPWRFLLVQE
jgi:hypothetical protein